MILAVSLAAAVLSGQTPPPVPPPAPAAAPRVERSVRVVRVDGPADGFARLDKDGDGFITRQDYVGPTEEAFRVLDRNGDGRISAEEFAEGRRTAGVILGDSTGVGGGSGGLRMFRAPGGPGGAGGPMTLMLRQGGVDGLPADVGTGDAEGRGGLDRDGDGKVSEEEFLAPIREAFRRMDKDGSGALEAGEHGDGSNVRVITRRVERSGT